MLEGMTITGQVCVQGDSGSRIELREKALGIGKGKEQGTRHHEAQPISGKAQLQNS